MQPWAKKFYRSRAWQQCREAYYVSKYGLCEQCGSAGLIVHHKIKLTPQNISDITVTLDWNNLQLLCLDCHNREHGQVSAAAGLKFDDSGELVRGYTPPTLEK
jgi:5-methylcytosine-specific restriction endonuclease McrA